MKTILTLLAAFMLNTTLSNAQVLIFHSSKREIRIWKKQKLTLIMNNGHSYKGVVDTFNLHTITLTTAGAEHPALEIQNIKAIKRCGNLLHIGAIAWGWGCRKTYLKKYRWRIKMPD